MVPTISVSSGWLIDNGLTTKFWTNNWVKGAGQVIDHVNNPNAIQDIQISIADMFNQGLPNVFQTLHQEINEKLQAVCALLSIAATNKRIWKHNNSGKFTLSSALQFLLDKPTDELSQPLNDLWGTIWKWEGPQRIKTFCGLP